MEKITQENIDLIVKTMAEVAIVNENYFSELDGIMGDADFGVSLAGGFKAVMSQWDTYDRSTIGKFLLKISTVIIANTGGCSGPIWGTLFMRCGMYAKDKTSLTLSDIVAMLKSAMEGIMARGGAKFGDKTLLDALDPAFNELEKWSNDNPKDILGAFQAAAEAAFSAIENTKNWTARRGRQSFTGERSIGTYDPGIVAVGTMARAIFKALKEKN